MSNPRLLVSRQGTIATVTFNRPERRNAFDLPMWRGLHAIMEELSRDDSLRCVVLRGAGEKAFSAGADIGAFEKPNGEQRSGRRNTRMCWTRACSRSGCASTRSWR